MSLRAAAGRLRLRAGAALGTLVGGRPMAARAGYAAGRVDPKFADWMPGPEGPNAIADRDLPTLRARARDAVRNHPLLAGASRHLCDHVVGSGITAASDTGDFGFDELLDAVFERWCQAADPGREMALPDLQRSIVAEMFEAGDALLVMSVAPAWRDSPRGWAAQVAVAEQVPVDVTGTTEGGNSVRHGVEFDRLDRVVAYYVTDGHPGDGDVFGVLAVNATWAGGVVRAGGGLRRVSAMDAALIRVPRAAALRGVPMVAASLLPCRLQHGFQDAAITQAYIAATLGVLVESAGGPAALTGDKAVGLKDAQGRDITAIRGPMVGFLPPGKGRDAVTVVGGNVPGPMLVPTVEMIATQMAASIGYNYPLLTGDYKGTTFAGGMLGQTNFAAMVHAVQMLIYRRVVSPLRHRVLVSAIAAGRIAVPDDLRAAYEADPAAVLRAVPLLPGRAWVNPSQEASAENTAIVNGTMSVEDALARRGTTLARVARQERREIDMRRRLGLPDQPYGGRGLSAAGAVASANAQSRIAEGDVQDDPAPADRDDDSDDREGPGR